MTAARSHRELAELDGDAPPRHPGRRLTEAEFVAWCTDTTWAEWVNGEVILMSPVNFEHANIFTFLTALLKGFVDEHDLGTVLTEPFQIRFGDLRRRRSPDLFFVSHQRAAMFRPAHLEGAPDLVIEIVSPDSQSRDRREKYLEYAAAGVREYWIIDPITQTIEAHRLVRGQYRAIDEVDGRIPSAILPGFYLKPEWLWRRKLPKVAEALRQINSAKRSGRKRKS